MSRIGKIARLGTDLREEIGQWIEAGVPGSDIVGWLNEDPAVQKVLEDYYDGQAITEQNLSDWRQGGHQEWLQYKAASLAVLDFMDGTEGVVEWVSTIDLVRRMSSMFAAELVKTSMVLLAKETDPEKKWKRLCEVHRELSRLRRDEHRELPSRLAAEKRKAEIERFQRQAILRWKAKQAEQAQASGGTAKKAQVCPKETAGGGVSQGVEHACGGEVRSDEGRVTRSAGAKVGRKSKGIVPNRVKTVTSDKGQVIGDGAVDGSGGGRPAERRTNERDARSTMGESKLIVPNRVKTVASDEGQVIGDGAMDGSGQGRLAEGRMNEQEARSTMGESGEIVPNRVKNEPSLEGPVVKKIVDGKVVYEYHPETMENRLKRLHAMAAAQALKG